jgi:predicted permease
VIFRRWDRAKESLSDELEFHLKMAIAERAARGEDPVQARAAAMREIGNLPLIKDVTREGWGWLWLESLLHDARYAFRQLRRSPVFTVTALLTLAFGIGANLAVFQLVYRVLLADLPVAHPEELVTVHAAPTPFDQDWAVSYPAYQRLRAAMPEAPMLASGGTGRTKLESPHHASAEAKYEMVSDNYFSILGVIAAAGRLFIEADANHTVSQWPAVLRYDFARDTFGSAEQAIGQHILLKGHAFVVVGVTHKRFLGLVTGYMPDVWIPLEVQSTGGYWTGFDSLGPGHDVHLDKPWLNQSTIFWLSLVARVSAKNRAAELAKFDHVFGPDRILMTEATADQAVKSSLLHATTTLVPVNHPQGPLRRRFSVALILLMALSASIFAVGCLNLANLQLARLHTRAHELGVRMALGATRLRLLRQIVFEDAILVLFGSAAAFIVGRFASEILVRWASSRNSLIALDLHQSLPITALGIALTFLSLLSFSILPFIMFMKRSTEHTAGSHARITGISQTAGQRWRSNSLLCVQVSLSLVLSTISACFAATLVHWETVAVGMDREHVLSLHIDMSRYGNHAGELPALFHQIQERLQSLPGVRGAAIELCGDIHCGWITALYVQGRSGLSNEQVHGQEDHVAPGYFASVGIPILRGRDFSFSDTTKTQPVAIISRSYAQKLFGNDDPIGQRVGYEPAPNDHKFMIVGEVADAHVNGPQLEAPPVTYMDIDQNPVPPHSIKVRAIGNPSELSSRVRETLHSVAPSLTISEITPLALELNGVLGTEKLLARLAGIYASLTLLLVAIGFYGVMSSRTTRRKLEFGVRLALGASRRQIGLLIMGQTARILLTGIVPGAILSLLAVRTSSHFLYGSVTENSFAIFVASLVLALAGSFATLIPARRAAFADPLESLRSD